MATINTLLSGRRLAGNALWNFVGMVAPMGVGIIAIPILIEGMGLERFGLLTIIWMGVGYFSLFDLGLGRALTKLVAERLGTDRTEDLSSLIWTALNLMLMLGLTVAVAVGFSAEPLVKLALNVQSEYQGEAVMALMLLAAGLPAVIATTALIGLLQAHQKFATITVVRIPLGIATFVGPLITLQFTPSLVWATVAMLVARILAFAAYFTVTVSVCPELKRPRFPDPNQVGSLLRFGGWLTITNIVGPLMVYFDRFFIGAVMTMTAVTYYVTPYEVISRVGALRGAITGVLFPALATAVTFDREKFTNIYSQASRTLVLFMLPAAFGFFLLAPEALEIWLGSDFRDMATPVVQWLALGMLVNTSAQAPVTVLQSISRPDLVAKIHLLEILPYAAMLWIVTVYFGIAGAAFTWFFRVLVDTLILNSLVWIYSPELAKAVKANLIRVFLVLTGFLLAWFAESIELRLLLLGTVSAYSAVSLWSAIRLFLPGRLSVR